MLTMTNIRNIIKSLIAAYLITAGLLAGIAFLLYRLEPKQSMVSLGILAVYVLSCFMGGFLAGKGNKSRRFLWGLATGVMYFLVLLLVSWISGNGLHSSAVQLLTILLLCSGGGMLGGMLS